MKGSIVVKMWGTWVGPLVVAGAALGLILAGCSPSQASTPAPANPSTPALPTHTPSPLPTPTVGQALEPAGRIEIWLSWSPSELEALHEVLDRYQREHPGVSIALAYYPPDKLLEAFKQAAAARRAPTILLGPSAWGPDLFRAGWLLDVGALLDPELDQAMVEAAWSQAIDGGALIGLPLEFQGVVIYRNRDLAPTPAVTVNDWGDRSRALREIDHPGMIWDMGFRNAGAALAACEGTLIDTNGYPAFWGPEGVCWLEMLETWAQGGRVVFDGQDDLQAFTAGQIPWLLESTDHLPALRAVLGERSLAIDPWPRYEATGLALKGFVWTENLYITVGHGSEDLEAAWGLARMLLSADVQALLADPAGAAHIPVRSDVELQDPQMESAAAMVRSGFPLPLLLDEERIGAALEVAAEDVLLKGAEPAFALALSRDRWEAAGGGGP